MPYRRPDPPLAEDAPERTLGASLSSHRVPFLPWLGAVFVMACLAVYAVFAMKPVDACAPRVPRYDEIAAIAVVASGLVVGWFLSAKGATYQLHEEGIAVRRWFRRTSVFFDDVDAVHYEMRPTLSRDDARKTSLVLVTFDGRRVRIPAGLRDARAIHDAVHGACVRPLMSEVARRFEDGEPLCFGPVHIEKRVIRVGSETLAWDELAFAEIDARELALHSRERTATGRPVDVLFATVPLGRIPHARLLATLLARHDKLAGDTPFSER